jgi:tetratricopeptide (TPR) repeat protein
MRTGLICLLVATMGCAPKTGTVEAAPATPAPTVAAVDASGAPIAPGTATADAAPIEEPSVKLKRVVGEATALLSTRSPESATLALAQLKGIQADNADVAEIPYNMGVAYSITGDVANARKSFLRATDIDPTLSASWLNLGILAERDGDLERALQNYRSGLRSAPDDVELVVAQVGALRKLGRYQEAINESKVALARNATNVNAYNNLGLVYLDQGQLEMAQFVYQKALTSIDGADRNALIHANLGRVYLGQKKTASAKVELERAISLDPELVPARMAIAQLHLTNRDYQAAAEALEKAKTIEPKNAAIVNNLAIAYRGLGKYEEAQAAYKQALVLDPSNPEPHLNLAVLLADYLKAYDQALLALEDYRRAGGSNTALATTWNEEILVDKERFEKEKERKKKRDDAAVKQAERERLAKEHEAREAAEAAADKAAAEQAAANEAARLAAEAAGAATPSGTGLAGAAVVNVVQGSAAIGTACTGYGQCGSPTLECSRAALCVDAGSLGALGAGVNCQQDTDCAMGLICSSNLCTAPAAVSNPWGAPQ